MERYKVKIEKLAEADVWEIVKHIALDLCEPETAVNIRERIYGECFSLDFMPKRYPLSRIPVFARRGYRVASAGNFLIFYTVNTSHRTVHVKRIIYGKRDWPSQL